MKGDGDRDGDGDVDATDKGTPGSTCTGTVTGACRILDLDFDGDYDATDATNQPFAHQGLLFEPEINKSRARDVIYNQITRRLLRRRFGGERHAYNHYRMNTLVAIAASNLVKRTLIHPRFYSVLSSAVPGSGGACAALAGPVTDCCSSIGNDKDAKGCYRCAGESVTSVNDIEPFASACLEAVWGAPPAIGGTTDAEGNQVINRTGNPCIDAGTQAHENEHLDDNFVDPSIGEYIQDELDAYNQGIGSMQGSIDAAQAALVQASIAAQRLVTRLLQAADQEEVDHVPRHHNQAAFIKHYCIGVFLGFLA